MEQLDAKRKAAAEQAAIQKVVRDLKGRKKPRNQQVEGSLLLDHIVGFPLGTKVEKSFKRLPTLGVIKPFDPSKNKYLVQFTNQKQDWFTHKQIKEMYCLVIKRYTKDILLKEIQETTKFDQHSSIKKI